MQGDFAMLPMPGSDFAGEVHEMVCSKTFDQRPGLSGPVGRQPDAVRRPGRGDLGPRARFLNAPMSERCHA